MIKEVKDWLVLHEVITKDRWYGYITFKHYLNSGFGEFQWVTSHLKNIVYVLLTGAATGILSNDIGFGQFFAVFTSVFYLVFLVFCYFFGKWKDGKEFFKVEQHWGYNNQRSVMFDDIKIIKEKLEELK